MQTDFGMQISLSMRTSVRMGRSRSGLGTPTRSSAAPSNAMRTNASHAKDSPGNRAIASAPVAGATTAQAPATATMDRVMRALTAALPLAMLLTTEPADAQRTVYYQAGAWHAFTDKDAQGAAVCGIETENPAAPGTLSFTYTIGGSDLTLTAAKPSWNIPGGTSISTSLLIDQGQPWTAQTTGHGTDVAWTIDAASIREFDTEFRNGHTMTVSFPSGNETPWTLSLRGSTAASETLWRCVQDLKDRAAAASAAPAATTPPNAGPPTQPFTQGSSQAIPPAPIGSSASGASAQPSAPTSAAPASSAPTVPAPASGAPAETSTPGVGTSGQTPPSANDTPAPASTPPASGTSAPAMKP